MNTEKKIFDYIQIQAEDVLAYKPKLSIECYIDLLEFVYSRNIFIDSINDIIRGQDIISFIANWKPKK